MTITLSSHVGEPREGSIVGFLMVLVAVGSPLSRGETLDHSSTCYCRALEIKVVSIFS